jgi:hypothetical protein
MNEHIHKPSTFKDGFYICSCGATIDESSMIEMSDKEYPFRSVNKDDVQNEE